MIEREQPQEYKNGYEFYLSLPKYGKDQVLSYKGLCDMQQFISDHRKHGKDPKFICAQPGSQTMFLANPCTNINLWGNRGGGKTFIMFLKMLPYINNPLFTAIALRKAKTESDKPGGLLDTSKSFFSEFGVYLESQNIRQWRYNHGGRLRFEYYSDPISEFKDRMQGGQMFFIGFDELAQAEKEYWEYLRTVNRSPMIGKPLMVGCFNPNPDSFLFDFIEYYIDEGGAGIRNRSGVIRYFYKYGNSPTDIIWGFTKRDVYIKGKHIIDEYLSPEDWKRFGDKAPYTLISEITFLDCDLSENDVLLTTQPDYKSKLSTGNESEDAINLKGIWKRVSNDSDVISDADMHNFFSNTPQYDDGKKYATLDPAYGGDYAIMALWIGHHLEELMFTKDFNGKTLKEWISYNLQKWDLSESRLSFDFFNAVYLESEFPLAKPIKREVINMKLLGKKITSKEYYGCLKSQMADSLITSLRNMEFSINKNILTYQYGNVTIRKAFMRQKSVIRFMPESRNGKLTIIKKDPDMKKILGGNESPDLIEGTLLYRTYWDLVRTTNSMNLRINKFSLIGI